MACVLIWSDSLCLLMESICLLYLVEWLITWFYFFHFKIYCLFIFLSFLCLLLDQALLFPSVPPLYRFECCLTFLVCIISDLLLYLLRQQDLRYSSHGDNPTPLLSFPHLTHLSQKRTWEHFTSVLCFPSDPWPSDDFTSVALSPPLLMLSFWRFTAFTSGLL